MHPTCSPRPELSDYNLPVGDVHVPTEDLANIQYRWKNEDTDDEQFQVLYENEWQDAYSTDFEFD